MTFLRQHINNRFRKPGNKAQAAQPESADNDADLEILEASESKWKSIAETLGEAAFSLSIILSLKILIPLVFAAVPAGIATIGIPVALIAMTTYGVLESYRHIRKRVVHHKHKILNDFDDISGKKALLLALKKNKFEVGAFIGSLGLLAMGIVADLTSVVGVLDLDKLTEMAVAETGVMSADKLIERGHEPKHQKPMTSRLKAAFNAVRTRQLKDRHYQPRHAKRKPGPALQLA